MAPNDYINMFNRFGKKLEKELMNDFPGDTDLLANVSDFITIMQYNILGAFLSDSVGKETE